MRDIDHFGRDDSGFGEFILRDHLTGAASAQDARGRTMRRQSVARNIAVIFGLHRTPLDNVEAARRDPGFAHRRQAGGQVDAGVGLGVRTGGIVDANRRLQRVAQDDFAQRHAHIGVRLRRGIDLMRSGDRPRRHALRNRLEFLRFGMFVHRHPPVARAIRARRHGRSGSIKSVV
jgi:hypothetical protein